MAFHLAMGSPFLRSLVSSVRLVAAVAMVTCSGACGSPPASVTPTVTVASIATPDPVKPGVEILWQQRAGRSGSIEIEKLAANAGGELMFMGGSSERVFLHRLHAGKDPGFQVLLASDGFQWNGIALDAEGNGYFAGRVAARVSFNGRPLEGPGSPSVLVLKLSPDEKNLWSVFLGGEDVECSAVSPGPRGDVLIAGNFAEDLSIGSEVLPGGAPGNGRLPYARNLFVAKLGPDGRARWGREFLGQGAVSTMAVDAKGQIYLAGDFLGSVAFNPTSPLRSKGGDDRTGNPFFVKLDASGRLGWQRHIDADGFVLSGDGSGAVYACDGAAKSQDVVKLGDDGRVLFRFPFGDETELAGCGQVASDERGNVYVLGVAADREAGDDGREGETFRILQLDGTGKVVSSLSLPANLASYTQPMKMVWSNGHLFVSGMTSTSSSIASVLAKVTM